MAAAAFFTRSCGVAVCLVAGTRSVVIVIMAVLSRSRLSRARNSRRGRLRSISSMCGREYSGIAALHRHPAAGAAVRTSHTPPQGLDRAELELLHRPFGFSQTFGRFADAALFDEAFDDHRLLV